MEFDLDWLKELAGGYGVEITVAAAIVSIAVPLWDKFVGAIKLVAAPIRSLFRRTTDKRDPILSPGILLHDGQVIGREKDIDKLHDLLWTQGKRSVAITPAVAVKGQGGIGKTTMARHYAKKYRAHYHGIWMVDAEGVETMIASFVELGRRIGVPEAAQTRDYARSVVGKLSERDEDWLIIFDNAWNPRQIREWSPANPKIRLLVTSREGGWGEGFALFEAEVLSSKEEDAPRRGLPPAIELIFKIAGRRPAGKAEIEEARALAVDLGGLPLALTQAGVWLRDSHGTIAAYRTEIETMLDRPLPADFDYQDSVFAAVSLSIERLERDASGREADTDAADRASSSPADPTVSHALTVLRLFCWLAPEGLDAQLLTDVPESKLPHPQEFWVDITDNVMTLCRNPAEVEAALQELVRRSLLEQRGESFAMHRLVQAVARAKLRQANGSASSAGGYDTTFASSAAAMVAAGYPGGRNPAFIHSWPQCARLTPHVSALVAHSPPIAAMDFLLNQATGYLGAQSRNAEAVRFAWSALRMTKERLPSVHHEVAIGYSVLGARLGAIGRSRSAEILSREAVDIVERITNIDTTVKAALYGNHGSSLTRLAKANMERGENSAAVELLHQAATRQQQALALSIADLNSSQSSMTGRLSDEIASSIQNLAHVRNLQGRWRAAQRLHSKASKIFRATLPESDPRLATSLTNLGACWLETGKPEEGVQLLEDALAICAAAYDNPLHPDTVETAKWLASAHYMLAGESGSDPHRLRAEVLCEQFVLARQRQQVFAAQYKFNGEIIRIAEETGRSEAEVRAEMESGRNPTT